MGFAYSAVGFILAIGILVAVHEFGHYWVAKKLGVKVLKFSVGFGKPLWKRVAGPDQTEYVLAAIPLGGYVKMLGENDPDSPIQEHERHRAFDYQPIWKRSLIVLAGPGINFLFAIFLFMLLGLQDKQQLAPLFGEIPAETTLASLGVKGGDRLVSVDGKAARYFGEHDLYIFNQVLKKRDLVFEIDSQGRTRTVTIATKDIPIYNINPGDLLYQLGFFPIPQPPTREIASVSKGSPADLAGLQAGDRFIAIDDQQVNSWQDLIKAVQPAANRELQIRLARDGVEFTVAVTPQVASLGDKKIGRLGVSPRFIPRPAEQIVTISNSPWQALQDGTQRTWEMSLTILRMLGKMVMLEVSPKNVNGPIMIADVAGDMMQIGLEHYVRFLALISISLGVMNLLPVPILDGGQLMRFVAEVFVGKAASERFYFAIQPLGLLMLFGLMSLAFYNDILKIFN